MRNSELVLYNYIDDTEDMVKAIYDITQSNSFVFIYEETYKNLPIEQVTAMSDNGLIADNSMTVEEMLDKTVLMVIIEHFEDIAVLVHLVREYTESDMQYVVVEM